MNDKNEISPLEENLNLKDNAEPQETSKSLLVVSCDNTIDETVCAYRKYSAKYSAKRRAAIFLSFLALVLGVFYIVRDSTNLFGVIIALSGGYMLLFHSTKVARSSKSMRKRLELMPAESYTISFFESAITIETNVDGRDTPYKVSYPVSSTEIVCEEDEQMFRLYFNKSLIYVIPKRCLSKDIGESLRNYLKEI